MPTVDKHVMFQSSWSQEVKDSVFTRNLDNQHYILSAVGVEPKPLDVISRNTTTSRKRLVKSIKGFHFGNCIVPVKLGQ